MMNGALFRGSRHTDTDTKYQNNLYNLHFRLLVSQSPKKWSRLLLLKSRFYQLFFWTAKERKENIMPKSRSTGLSHCAWRNYLQRPVHGRQCISIFKICFFQGGNSARGPLSSTGTKGPMTGITWQLLTDPIQEHDIKVESLPLPSVLFADLK